MYCDTELLWLKYSVMNFCYVNYISIIDLHIHFQEKFEIWLKD